jgi:lipopolysaccharide/colanic/teichoic acid biosynthesis glycosyltransferase
MVGIKLSNNGPIFYKSLRVGKDGNLFTMYKFRSMKLESKIKSSITGTNDPRVFSFGNLLRKTKIDELPQLFNILKGEMSIVGPRPEDPLIVEKYYSNIEKRTLSVLPGLASPGSIFNYTHSNIYLQNVDIEQDYVNNLLPIKLKLELYYVDHRNLLYDFIIIIRTIRVVFLIICGKKSFKYPKEFNFINN